MTKHIMVDLETLDFKPSSVILTLGAVKFDPYALDDPDEPFYLRINVDEQLALGRTTSDSTLQWWMEQSEEIREEAMGEKDRTPVAQAVDEFHKYVWNAEAIWAHGPQFDMVIIEDLYRMLGKPLGWKHNQIFDSRTMVRLGIDTGVSKGDQAHNALADAYWQAKALQVVFNKLGLKKP